MRFKAKSDLNTSWKSHSESTFTRLHHVCLGNSLCVCVSVAGFLFSVLWNASKQCSEKEPVRCLDARLSGCGRTRLSLCLIFPPRLVNISTSCLSCENDPSRWTSEEKPVWCSSQQEDTQAQTHEHSDGRENHDSSVWLSTNHFIFLFLNVLFKQQRQK